MVKENKNNKSIELQPVAVQAKQEQNNQSEQLMRENKVYYAGYIYRIAEKYMNNDKNGVYDELKGFIGFCEKERIYLDCKNATVKELVNKIKNENKLIDGDIPTILEFLNERLNVLSETEKQQSQQQENINKQEYEISYGEGKTNKNITFKELNDMLKTTKYKEQLDGANRFLEDFRTVNGWLKGFYIHAEEKYIPERLLVSALSEFVDEHGEIFSKMLGNENIKKGQKDFITSLSNIAKETNKKSKEELIEQLARDTDKISLIIKDNFIVDFLNATLNEFDGYYNFDEIKDSQKVQSLNKKRVQYKNEFIENYKGDFAGIIKNAYKCYMKLVQSSIKGAKISDKDQDAQKLLDAIYIINENIEFDKVKDECNYTIDTVSYGNEYASKIINDKHGQQILNQLREYKKAKLENDIAFINDKITKNKELSIEDLINTKTLGYLIAASQQFKKCIDKEGNIYYANDPQYKEKKYKIVMDSDLARINMIYDGAMFGDKKVKTNIVFGEFDGEQPVEFTNEHEFSENSFRELLDYKRIQSKDSKEQQKQQQIIKDCIIEQREMVEDNKQQNEVEENMEFDDAPEVELENQQIDEQNQTQDKQITEEQQKIDNKLLTPEQSEIKNDYNQEDVILDVNSDVIDIAQQQEQEQKTQKQSVNSKKIVTLNNTQNKGHSEKFDARISTKDKDENAKKVLCMFDLEKIDMFYKTEIFDPEQIGNGGYVEVGFSTMLARLFETKTLTDTEKVNKLKEFYHQFENGVTRSDDHADAKAELLDTLTTMISSLSGEEQNKKLDDNELYMNALFFSCKEDNFKIPQVIDQETKKVTKGEFSCCKFLFGGKEQQCNKNQQTRKDTLKKYILSILPKKNIETNVEQEIIKNKIKTINEMYFNNKSIER